MKILVLSSFLPYPLFSGGHVRLFNIIKELNNNGHKITLVCEKRDSQTEDDVRELEKICQEVVWVPRQKQWSIENILKTGISKNPFLITGHTQTIIEEKILELILKQKFDLIHVETFYVMQNLPKVSLPIVLVEHNIEYLVYKRYLENSPFFVRPLFMLDVFKMKKIEEMFWKKANVLVAVSDEERKQMKIKDTFVVPNGVDINKFKINNIDAKINQKEKLILYIGDFKWIQNINACKVLLEQIWPRISSKSKEKDLNVKLWVVGRKIPESIKNLTNDKNVFFDENAPKETAEIFNKSHILLAPIRVGGGTSFKILESMASGVPVATTSLGIEGIDATLNESVLVSDKMDELADLTLGILENRGKYKKIALNARKLIEEKYDWKKIVKMLEMAYEKAVKN